MAYWAPTSNGYEQMFLDNVFEVTVTLKCGTHKATWFVDAPSRDIARDVTEHHASKVLAKGYRIAGIKEVGPKLILVADPHLSDKR